MSEYIKTEWETGDVITAEKLNNIEDGIDKIANGDFQIEGTVDKSTGSITYNTIRPGLTAEDFIGETVHVSGYALINYAVPSDPSDDTTVSLSTSNGASLLYNRVTGAITEVDESEGEGGSK